MKYLGRRLFRALVMLAGVSVLCFLFSEMAPGSFFDEMRLNPQISPDTIASLQSRYGLNQPLVVRYGRWVRSAARADFGYSIAYNAPVGPLLRSRAGNTLVLTSVGLILTWLVSVPLGVWVAARHGKWLDKLVGAGSSFIVSIPEVVLAVGLLAIVVHWRLLPVGGMVSANRDDLSTYGKAQDFIRHLLLPVFILTLVESAIIVRHVRASVLETLEMPFVQAARGFGIGQARLLFRSVLAAAAEPGHLAFRIFAGWTPQRFSPH